MVKHSVPVLMYHHVRPEAGMIACTPENFEDQLRWLQKQGYRSLTLAEFNEHLNGKDVGKAVLITFDDGYLDNWVYAYPLLQKYQFNATIFLVTSWLNHGPLRSHLGQGDLPTCPEHYECEALVEQDRTDEVILRWSEVQAMRESGVVEFHSHTHTHTRWDLMPHEDKNARMRTELDLSRLTLQRELGECSPHLCWPQGYFDEDYVEIAKEAGFTSLYTTLAFGRNTQQTSPLRIHRFAVRNRPGRTLGKRLFYGHHPIMGPIFNNGKRWIRRLKWRPD